MTTDNRTNEQIVQDRLTMMPKNERAYVAAKAVEVLRTAGRLVGEPTEAMVEAAARALWELHARGDDPLWSGGELDYGIKQIYRKDARAALVAAQGAAPQTESEELAWYKKAAKHSADSMAEARATLQQLADRVDPFVFDELSSVLDDQPLDYETGWAIGEPAPVLPSNTVNEDARSLSAWPTVDEVRERFEKSADRIAFGRMIAEVERAAAEKAWDRCVGEMPIDPDWKNFYGDNNPYRAAAYRREETE